MSRTSQQPADDATQSLAAPDTLCVFAGQLNVSADPGGDPVWTLTRADRLANKLIGILHHCLTTQQPHHEPPRPIRQQHPDYGAPLDDQSGWDCFISISTA